MEAYTQPVAHVTDPAVVANAGSCKMMVKKPTREWNNKCGGDTKLRHYFSSLVVDH